MGLLKKKNGKPSLFGKIVKGAGKVVAVAASVAPIPGAGKVGSLIGKVADKIQDKSKGLINLHGAKPKAGEKLASYVNRLKQGAGGALAGAAAQIENEDTPNLLGQRGLEKGATNEALKKYGLIAAAVVAGIIIIKKIS